MDASEPVSYNSTDGSMEGNTMVKIIEVQGTPNPDALKFIADARLVERGACSFEDAASAKGHPLAAALFAAGPVASVFILDRFVTVTKFPNGDWAALEPKLRTAIEGVAQAAPEPGARLEPRCGRT